jgi:beta-catenin-like protein 1
MIVFMEVESVTNVLQELARTGKSAEQDLEDVWYLERLEGGLYQLQSGDYILGWVSAEDDGVCIVTNERSLCTDSIQIRAHVETMLARVSQSFKDVLEVLASQLESMEEDSSATHAEAESQKEALRGLVQHLSASS